MHAAGKSMPFPFVHVRSAEDFAPSCVWSVAQIMYRDGVCLTDACRRGVERDGHSILKVRRACAYNVVHGCARLCIYGSYYIHGTRAGLAPGRRDDDMRHAEMKEKSDTICGAAGRARPPCRPPQRGRSVAWGSYSYTLVATAARGSSDPRSIHAHKVHARRFRLV